MGEIFSTVCQTIKEYIEGLVFAFNNWDLVVKTVGIEIAMAFVGIGDRIAWFGQQTVILLQWACANWKGLFIDYFNLGKTVFVNLCTNIKSLWEALMGWFKGQGFHYNWTPLMQGFESAIKEAPKFQAFVHSDLYNGLSQQLGEVGKDWDKRAEKWQASMDKAKIDKKKAKEAVDATIGIVASDTNGGKDKGKGGNFEGLADFWKKRKRTS